MTILKASVYNPDGGIYPLEPARIKTSRPQSEGGSFFVSGSVCTQYLMPNVQAGSIVDYITETETYNPFRKDFFFPSWGFQDSEGPVGLSEISVSVPEASEFYYSVRNFPGPGAPKMSSAGGMKISAGIFSAVSHGRAVAPRSAKPSSKVRRRRRPGPGALGARRHRGRAQRAHGQPAGALRPRTDQ
mgnify:CR=1 FL=1